MASATWQTAGSRAHGNFGTSHMTRQANARRGAAPATPREQPPKRVGHVTVTSCVQTPDATCRARRPWARRSVLAPGSTVAHGLRAASADRTPSATQLQAASAAGGSRPATPSGAVRTRRSAACHETPTQRFQPPPALRQRQRHRTRSARESEPLRRNAGHAVAAGRQCATSAILRDGDGSVMPQEMTRITSHTPSHKSRRTWRASSLPWERHSFGRAAPVGSARTRTASAGGGLQQGGWSWTQQPAGYSVRRAPGRASGLRFGREAPRRDARPADRTDASVSTVGCFGTSAPWEASDYCMARSRPLMGRSPRKHRAMMRRQRRVIATDLTVEESPEVGQLASTLPGRAPACGS